MYKLNKFLLIKFSKRVIQHLMSGNGDAFRFLAHGFQYPEEQEFIEIGWEVLKGLSHDLDLPIGQFDTSTELPVLQTEYVRLFINSPTGVVAPPYASHYISRSQLLFQEGADEALCFYREVGMEPESGIEPPDHIATELAFVSYLLDSGNSEHLLRFVSQHLMVWYPKFLDRLLSARPAEWYCQLGRVTGVMLKKIMQEGGVQ